MLTDASSPLRRSKVPRAAPPSIIMTLMPPSCSCLTSDQRVSYMGSFGWLSFKVMSPGCSLRCTADSRICVTPVCSCNNGKSDKGPPSTDLNVWIYATRRGGAAAVATSFEFLDWSIECGSAQAVDVKASSVDSKTLNEGILFCPVGKRI